MTAREFDIRAAYDEWDGLKGRKGPKAVDGERAYQMMSGGARPSDGFPCRVEVPPSTTWIVRVDAPNFGVPVTVILSDPPWKLGVPPSVCTPTVLMLFPSVDDIEMGDPE